MNQEKLKHIQSKIEEFDTIIITPHARPDGDCMGTAFGLKSMIKNTYPNKNVYVVGEEASYVKFLGSVDEIEDEVFNDALVIAVDTGNSARVADQRFSTGKYVIKIDHHIPVDSYGDYQYVDTTRPAAALIILDLLAMYQDTYKIDQAGMQALYTGTLTDTGRFKYPGVDGDTFRRVAMLYDLGLETAKVVQHLDTRSEPSLRFKGYVLQNYKKTTNGVAYIEITHDLLDQFGVTVEEASSNVNELSVFEDCPIWVLLAEYEEKIVRARIRSKGPVINTIAGDFDGGGHAMASGANLGTWERAEELLTVLDKVAKDYKETN